MGGLPIFCGKLDGESAGMGKSLSKQLLKSTATVGGMTFISRVLGFIRDMVAAHFFGAGTGYDAFIVASKIPNFMRRLFAEGAFSQAFVPLLSEYRANRQPQEVEVFVNRVASCLAMVLFGVTIVGMLCAPLFIYVFAPGFANDLDPRFSLATQMLRITFPYLLLISLTAFCGGILNTYGRFSVPAFTPVFLNLSLIASALFLAPLFSEPVVALAWGVFIGGIIQLGFQFPFLKQLRLFPSFQWGWRDPGVRRLLTLMVPALLGVSVTQLNLALSAMFASFLPVGSVSWLYYAERLMEFPLGGFGVALATVVLPKLSSYHAKEKASEFSKTLDFGVRWVLLIGCPSALGLALLAGPLISTLFQSGRFGEMDVLASQSALIAYSTGIVGFMFVKILGSAYYAKQDIKTPVKIAMVIVVANIVLSLVLIKPLAHMGLALATGLCALLNGILLGVGLLKRKVYQLQPGWKVLLARLALALAGMTLFLLSFNPSMETWFLYTRMEKITALALLIVGGSLVYIAALFMTGLRVNHLLVKPAESS